MLRDSTPRYVSPLDGWLVGWLVGRSVPFVLFWRFWAFLAYGSCPDALVTFSSTATVYPHATDWDINVIFFTLIIRHLPWIVCLESWCTSLFVFPSSVIRLLLRQNQFRFFFLFLSVVRHSSFVFSWGRRDTALSMTKIRHPSFVIYHPVFKQKKY